MPGCQAKCNRQILEVPQKLFSSLEFLESHTKSSLMWIASPERGGAERSEAEGVRPDDTTYGRRQAVGVVSVGCAEARQLIALWRR